MFFGRFPDFLLIINTMCFTHSRRNSAKECWAESKTSNSLPHYSMPTVTSICRSRSPSPVMRRKLADINLSSTIDPRPPFVVRKVIPCVTNFFLKEPKNYLWYENNYYKSYLKKKNTQHFNSSCSIVRNCTHFPQDTFTKLFTPNDILHPTQNISEFSSFLQCWHIWSFYVDFRFDILIWCFESCIYK